MTIKRGVRLINENEKNKLNKGHEQKPSVAMVFHKTTDAYDCIYIFKFLSRDYYNSLASLCVDKKN